MNHTETHLHQMTTARTLMGIGRAGFYLCLEDFVLQNGTTFAAAPLPSHYPRGVMKRCFGNSAEMAQHFPDLKYFEGYGTVKISDDFNLTVNHAWNVDPAGNVVDVTWGGRNNGEPLDYVGVEFPLDYVLATARRVGEWGVIDNWQERYPLLRQPYSPAVLNFSTAPLY